MSSTLILIISIICILLCHCAFLLLYWFKLIKHHDEENKEKLNAIVATVGLFLGSAGAIGLVISIIGFIPTNSNSTIDTLTQETQTENTSTFISYDDAEKESTTTPPITEFNTYTQSFENEIYADESNVFLNVGDEAIITVTVLGSHKGVTVGTTDRGVATAVFSPARWDGNNVTVKITAKSEGTARIKVYLKDYSDTVYTYIDVTVQNIS